MRQVASDYDGISHELFQIANNLERMDQFNPQQKLFSLVRNAEVSTVSLRNLTARTVRDDTAHFYGEVADLLGIRIDETHDWLKITVPAILPKRNQRDNQAFLTRPLRYALLDFLKENPMERFGSCAICIVHNYDEALGKRRIRDYDNIETKRYLDVIESSTRMYWMKNSEENYAAAVKSLLLARGFGVTTIHQVVIGSTMSVAQRLCHSAKPFGNKYFVVSTFFAQCLFLTNNPDGDSLLKIILNPDMALELNQAILAPYDYSLHPDYKKLKSRKAILHEPDWKTSQASSVSATGPSPSSSMATPVEKGSGNRQKKPPAKPARNTEREVVNADDIF